MDTVYCKPPLPCISRGVVVDLPAVDVVHRLARRRRRLRRRPLPNVPTPGLFPETYITPCSRHSHDSMRN
jgi:hypothetical protein